MQMPMTALKGGHCEIASQKNIGEWRHLVEVERVVMIRISYLAPYYFLIKSYVTQRKARCTVNILNSQEEEATTINHNSSKDATQQQTAEPANDVSSRKRKTNGKTGIHSQFSEAIHTFKQFCSSCVDTEVGNDEINFFSYIIRAKLQKLTKDLLCRTYSITALVWKTTKKVTLQNVHPFYSK